MALPFLKEYQRYTSQSRVVHKPIILMKTLEMYLSIIAKFFSGTIPANRSKATAKIRYELGYIHN
jgi:hypothetical protein